jgi:hypothetical protein
MPAGRWLFFPVANYVFIITEPEETEEIARQAANEYMDSVMSDPDLSIAVSVDGQEVPRRADSPLFTVEIQSIMYSTHPLLTSQQVHTRG